MHTQSLTTNYMWQKDKKVGVIRLKNGMEVVPHVRPRTTHLHGVTCVWCIPTVMIKVMGQLSKLYERTLLPISSAVNTTFLF